MKELIKGLMVVPHDLKKEDLDKAIVFLFVLMVLGIGALYHVAQTAARIPQ
jgi:hypothetical protein